MSDAEATAPAQERRGRKPAQRPEVALLGEDPKELEALERRGRLILDLAGAPKVTAGVLEGVATADNRKLAVLAKKAASVQDDQTPRFSIVRITPEMARDLLAIAFRSKRTYRYVQATVDALVDDLKAGRWVLNGNPLIFGKGAERPLLDGYARLLACARSGVAIDTVLAQNIAEDAVFTLDQARRRTFVQVLEAEGQELAPAMVPALSRLIRIQEGTLGRRTAEALLPWGKLERFWIANKDDLIKATEWAVARKTPLLGEAPRIILSFISHRSDKVDLLRDMLDGLRSPHRHEDKHPGSKLHQALKSISGRVPLVSSLALSVLAWNDMVTGQRSLVYKWTPPDEEKEEAGDEFPEVLDYPGLHRPALEEGAVEVNIEQELAFNYSGISITVETITPDLARVYLEKNKKNRKPQPSHVKMLAHDLAEGVFRFNAQPVCFGNDGLLINGQHRLFAIAESGISAEMLVVRGLPREAFHTFDRTAKRSASFEGVTNLDNVGDVDIVRGIATLYWRYDIHGGQRVRPSVHDLRRLVEEHPGLARMRHWGRALRAVGRPSTMGYVAYRIICDDERLGTYFLARLQDGADLGKRSPIRPLRDRLLKTREGSQKRNRTEPIDEIMSVWQKWKAGEGQTLAANAVDPEDDAIAAAERKADRS